MFNSYKEEFFSVINNTNFIIDKNNVNSDKFLNDLANRLYSIKKSHKGVFFIGNGASQSMADHFSADFLKTAKIITFSLCNSYLTAISNDDSYEDIFSSFISEYVNNIGIIFAISSSGESPNILKAIKEASKNNIFIVSLTGKNDNNSVRNLSHFSIHCPSNYYGIVESAHAFYLHSILDTYLDKYEGTRI